MILQRSSWRNTTILSKGNTLINRINMRYTHPTLQLGRVDTPSIRNRWTFPIPFLLVHLERPLRTENTTMLDMGTMLLLKTMISVGHRLGEGTTLTSRRKRGAERPAKRLR